MTITDSPAVDQEILLIGDLLIDETWYVDARKISPEAPVPVAYLTNTTPVRTPGGAGLAASYAAKRKFPLRFLSVVSPDNSAWLGSSGINILPLLSSKKNIEKIRYIDQSSSYHVLRVDTDDVVDKRPILANKMREVVSKVLKERNIGCIAALDYNKGIFELENTCQELVNIGKENDIPIYVDSRGKIEKFKGADFLKLNDKELAVAYATLGIETKEDLARLLDINNIIITHGRDGATLTAKLLSNTVINKTYVADPYKLKHGGTPDPTGCGDVFDMNWCYYYFIEGNSMTKTLELAVDNATLYAHEPIDKRLC